jgi:hypothetical protein
MPDAPDRTWVPAQARQHSRLRAFHQGMWVDLEGGLLKCVTLTDCRF